jgi:hypothetical protein
VHWIEENYKALKKENEGGIWRCYMLNDRKFKVL